MKRRSFVKKVGIFTTGTIALSSTNLYATETENSLNTIDFSPVALIENELTLKGFFIDSITLKPILSPIKMEAKVKRNRFFPLNKSLESTNSSYHIRTGFSKSNIQDKIDIHIQADGYKPYNGNIYLTTKGCYIHSEEWNYNPNFKPEFTPKNINSGNQTTSSFNFHLVKI